MSLLFYNMTHVSTKCTWKVTLIQPRLNSNVINLPKYLATKAQYLLPKQNKKQLKPNLRNSYGKILLVIKTLHPNKW